MILTRNLSYIKEEWLMDLDMKIQGLEIGSVTKV